MPPSLESDIIVPNSRLDLYRYFFAVRNHRNLVRFPAVPLAKRPALLHYKTLCAKSCPSNGADCALSGAWARTRSPSWSISTIASSESVALTSVTPRSGHSLGSNTCCVRFSICLSVTGSVQARKCRENGNIMDEYRSLFKATSILMQTIPKHTNYKEPRWQKLHTDLSKTLKDDVVRLEELKTLIKSGQVTVLRAIKPGAIRVEASRMPPVDWTLHIPTVAGTAHMPQHFFVNNPTVERIASQPAGTVATVGDPNDPFAASAAFSTLSLAPGVPPPPPPPAGVPFTGAFFHLVRQGVWTLLLLPLHMALATVSVVRVTCWIHAS